MGTRTLRRIILTALAVVVVLIVASNINFGSFGSGDSDRSTKAYCHTWESEARKQSAHYDEVAKHGSLTEQIQLVMGMPGDMAEFYGKVDKVAPGEIEPDIARAQRDAQDFDGLNGKVPTDASGLGSNLGEKLLKSLTSTPTQKRIHDWNKANCPDLPDYFN
ncbi:MAG TPA: hypothetical protein VJ843_02900 [Candidatus Saccharimonadales bacterium]|nr:hypothetical protein [Candidatus Saccharimonadales bacterium]